MRRWLFVLTLAACSHTGSSGPAWPKDRARDDGGESIAPREGAKSVVAEIEQDGDDGDDKPADKPAEKPADKPAAATTEAAPAAAGAPASEEPIQTEEIVIEIGPDD